MARKREPPRSPRRQKRQNSGSTGTRAEPDVGYVKMRAQLAPLGLALREIPGDGNCLFRALADQLSGCAGDHKIHRRETVDFIVQHREEFEPFVEDDVPFDRHVSNLGDEGTYAGNDSIVAFARHHGVTVVIHQLGAPLWQIHGDPENVPGSLQLHIAYHDGEHYNSVRKLGDYSNGPANVFVNLDAGGKLVGAAATGPEESAVMRRAGCSDLTQVRRVLNECGGDQEAAVDYLLALSSWSGSDSPVAPSSPLQSGVARTAAVATAARVTSQLPSGAAKLSSRQRKEQDRQRRREERERRRRRKDSSASDRSSSPPTLTPGLAALSI